MSAHQSTPDTTRYLGIRLTVQCDDPNDPFHQPQEFFPEDRHGGVFIGSSVGNDISLPNQGVASVHCRIEVTDNGYVLEDSSGTNVTFVGYNRLEQGQRHLLQDGDIIRVFNYNITFRSGVSAYNPQGHPMPVEQPTPPPQQAPPAAQAAPQNESPYIKCLTGSFQGNKYPFEEYQDFTIGRDPTSSLFLDNDAVSRNHALIRRDWSGVTITDQGSANGLFVNQNRLQPYAEAELNEGDQITVGYDTFSFHDPVASSIADKLKGVWVEESGSDDPGGSSPEEVDGVTFIASKALQINPKDIDVREPVSGRWKTPGRSKDKQEGPSQKVEVNIDQDSVSLSSSSPASSPTPTSSPQTKSKKVQKTRQQKVPSSKKKETSVKRKKASKASLGQKQRQLLWIGAAFLGLVILIGLLSLAFI